MASLHPTGNLEHPETTQHQNTTGLLFDSISLSLGDILEFARENALTVNFDLLMSSNQEAMECVQKRIEKQHLRFLKSSQPDSPATVTISAFGMLLQNALGHEFEVSRSL